MNEICQPPNDQGGANRKEELIKEAIVEIRREEAELKRAEGELENLEHQLEHELEQRNQTLAIVVDGTPHEIPSKEHITYVEVVTLAYPDYPQHPEVTYSVTYTRGHSEKPEGILSPDGSVKAKEGMAFIVNRTGQS